ncbi:DNA-processing protein DprA [Lysobacter sp. Root494]|uniref:DNA-processing protein DprA n=1 Tax=Lysobacter sp. Root494 TaxID=1736549 RepID=UPI0006FDC57C|nr:DNA-processing protein DprA [Lysobacter sp. Root494]KQY54864.1 DNA processing protein DprA [Lysobacter sp. Root494]
MHTDDDIDALLRLVAAGGAAAPRKALLDHERSPSSALREGSALWRACRLSDAQISALLKPDEVTLENAKQWLAQPNHHLVDWSDPDYPPLLRRSPNAPFALFVAGDPALLWHPGVAVVGSRAATPGGRDNAAVFARAIANAGFVVASGLAAGVDAAAHEAALNANGSTIAVLGTGTDVAYPRGHAALHARVAEAGAVVSEHLPATGARAEHFPSRNRILAGLSLGTLVIEAAERSGALITARQAAEAGREVFAVPGSIHNPLARGCHRLIRDGAALVETADEVIAALAPTARELAGDLRRRLGDPTSMIRMTCQATATSGNDDRFRASGPGGPSQDADYQKLWKALGHDPTGMDQLVERTGLTPAELSSMLLLMELDGRVTTQHGRYHRSR